MSSRASFTSPTCTTVTPSTAKVSVLLLRPALSLERRRLPHELDTFLWVCEQCGNELYRESFHLTDIVQQLPPIFARYWGDAKNTTCKKCGHKHEKR